MIKADQFLITEHIVGIEQAEYYSVNKLLLIRFDLIWFEIDELTDETNGPQRELHIESIALSELFCLGLNAN